MAIRLKHRSPTGETRPWTLRELIQGRPIDRPTHPMLVHFPIAFYLGALGLDILSRLGRFPGAPVAATWLILAALVAVVGAAITGLADRASAPAGGKVRRMATRHAVIQVVAAAFFAVNLAVRWSDRHAVESDVWWIVLGALGSLAMSVGADIGGRMVYKVGWRPPSD